MKYKLGDNIPESMYTSYRDCVPPLRLPEGYDGFYMGEPADHHHNSRGHLEPRYHTFVRLEGKYYYAGLNFEGEITSPDIRFYPRTSYGSESVELHLPQTDVVIEPERLLIGHRIFPCGNGDDYMLNTFQYHMCKLLIETSRQKRGRNL